MSRLEYAEVLESDPGHGLTTWSSEGSWTKSGSRSWSATRFLRELLLPHGYPGSVSRDYAEYQLWDSVQALACYVGSSLSTQAVLKGVGVGDEAATPLAAAMAWMLRNGASTMGNIVFSYFKSVDMDHQSKKWRLVADLLNDLSLIIELAAPLAPAFAFQLVLCSAGVARSVVGVAGGATRTAITQHQARANNISDVAVKDGSQETLVNLVALAINLVLLPTVANNEPLIWTLFLSLVAVHLYANYRAVKSLRFESLNKQRLLILLKHYFKHGTVLGVSEANVQESVWLGMGEQEQGIVGKRIRLGVSFGTFCPVDDEMASSLEESLKNRGYAIIPKDEEQLVLLAEKSDNDQDVDLLKAYLHACFHARLTKDNKNTLEIERKSKEGMNKFLQLLKSSSWRSDFFLVATEGFRGNVVKGDKKLQ